MDRTTANPRLDRPARHAARSALLVAVLGLLGHAAAAETELPTVRGATLQGPVSYADIVEPAMRAVVSVQPLRGSRTRSGEGSGVVVRADGVILTNEHLVDGVDRVRVTFWDRRETAAWVVGRDEATDLAVLRVDLNESLPILPLGDSESLRVGDVVFAIGNPLGMGQTASMGIVSATRRQLGITSYDDLIQTDAAINPGNSGGALIDAHGRLVGINTAFVYRGEAMHQGIGLAVPMALARRVLSQLLHEGHVTRSYLGVGLVDVDGREAHRLGLDRPAGALVTEVMTDTPAQRAGLREGDLVVSIDGRAVDSMQDLRLAISTTSPGTTVELALVRDGARTTARATLTELRTGGSDAPWGFEVAEETDDGRRRVVVRAVRPFGPADRAGVLVGDVVLRAGRESIERSEALRSRLDAAGAELRLEVGRGDARKELVLRR